MIENDNNISEKVVPCYDLEPNKVNLLTEELLRNLASDVISDGKFVTIEVDGNSKYSNIGRYVEIAAFQDMLANNTDLCAEEYAPYESTSKFFISIDRTTERPVGVLRTIGNSSNGIKTLNDVQGEPFYISMEDVESQHGITDLDRVWDIGTVAVLPEYRGVQEGLVSTDLYRALYLASNEHGIDHWVSVINNKLFRVLKDYLAMPFIPLAGSSPGPYLGSKKNYAVYANVSEVYEQICVSMMETNNNTRKNIMGRLVSGENDSSIVLEQPVTQ